MASGIQADSVIDLALQEGILRSERRRVALFLVVLGLVFVLVLGFLIMPSFLGGLLTPDLRARLADAAPLDLLAVGLMLAYEVGVLLWLRKVDPRTGPGTAFRYVNATFEACMVTILLALSVKPLGALQIFSAALPLLYFPVIVLSALNLNLRLSIWSGVVSAAGFLAVSLPAVHSVAPVAGLPILTTPYQYVLKAFIILMSGVASGVVAGGLRAQLLETLRAGRDRDRAISIFGQHVSPQVAERLLRQRWELVGEERHVCVMFLDIRNFSGFAATKSASEVMEFLNRFFRGLIDCVNDHRGIVNKFLGDGFMAVFGAPADDLECCANAIRCGRALLEEVERMNRAGEIPPTKIGIGLHFGPAVTGIVGSQQRQEYTVIGDTVNLAARIEQATKPLGCSFLVSDAVHAALRGTDLEAEDQGEVELKGQSKPARLFKLA